MWIRSSLRMRHVVTLCCLIFRSHCNQAWNLDIPWNNEWYGFWHMDATSVSLTLEPLPVPVSPQLFLTSFLLSYSSSRLFVSFNHPSVMWIPHFAPSPFPPRSDATWTCYQMAQGSAWCAQLMAISTTTLMVWTKVSPAPTCPQVKSN